MLCYAFDWSRSTHTFLRENENIFNFNNFFDGKNLLHGDCNVVKKYIFLSVCMCFDFSFTTLHTISSFFINSLLPFMCTFPFNTQLDKWVSCRSRRLIPFDFLPVHFWATNYVPSWIQNSKHFIDKNLPQKRRAFESACLRVKLLYGRSTVVKVSMICAK